MNHRDFDRVVEQLETVRDKQGSHLKMASIIVSQGDSYFEHYFQPKQPVDIRSIAKPIVCLALGIAIENGLYLDGERIELNTPIWSLLSKYVSVHDPKNRDKWEQVRLVDCLRITLGHDRGLVFSSDVKAQGESNLIDYVVNYPITGEVGRNFVYSNAGTFVISTLITEYLGKGLDEFVSDYVFSPLKISDYVWKKYGKYCAGCTGLVLQNEDLHKIGRLIINDGIYGGSQIAPRHWIDMMRSPQVDSPTHRYVADRAFPKWSYGLNLWICEDGNYYCDGTDGQYMVFIAEKGIIITTLGYQPDTEPVSHCLGMLK
jgi:CubicO group peptidase (beta-lactamase class C family)